MRESERREGEFVRGMFFKKRDVLVANAGQRAPRGGSANQAIACREVGRAPATQANAAQRVRGRRETCEEERFGCSVFCALLPTVTVSGVALKPQPFKRLAAF